MKRVFTFFMSLLFVGQLFAGGILTNTNQSVMYNRMQARDATLGIDAVYFNPAGLSFLPNNGFYFSLNNQTVGQTRNISSDYEFLNDGEYVGEVFAPFFPSIYAAYKMDKLAFSFGFNPIAGGGGGTYDTGLPSFEYGISELVPALSSQGAQEYRMDAYFEGSSAWFGYQGNVTYQVNENLSVALGARFVQAKDTYTGYLRGVDVNMGGMWMPANGIMTGIADQFRPGLVGTDALVDGGAGSLTFAQAEGAGIIDATTRAQLEGGILAMGQDPTNMTIEEANGYYSVTVNKYDGTATALSDQKADVEKTGFGITPIISIDYKLNDKFNFAFKYEHNTKIELTNATADDFITGTDDLGNLVTKFPDGEKERLDIPSQIVLGATFKPIDKLLLSTGYHMYLDKQADWNGREELLTGNSWEFALGAEYSINEMFLVSMGWLRTSSGADGDYQTDLSYSMPSNTIGGGFAVNFNPKLQLNVGGQYTMYSEGSHDFVSEATMLPYTETYDKDVWIIGVGLNVNLGAGK